MRKLLAALPLVLLASACADGNAVTRADFESQGKTWPLTVDAGEIGCLKRTSGRNEVTFSAGGAVYAVNGTAKANGSYRPIDPIWADDGRGAKKNIGDLLAYCDGKF